MEKFYLEVPSLGREKEAIEYIQEFINYNSNINGVGGLAKYLEKYSYLKWLEYLKDIENEDGAQKYGRVPSRTYFLIREDDNKIIGMINIRLMLNEQLRRHGGHIGYGIRPTERRKGYNKINLYLGLMEAKRFGIDKVMLSCSVSNLGSDKTIQALGGIFERTEVDSDDGELSNIYWIDVNDSLKKYRDVYIKKLVRK